MIAATAAPALRLLRVDDAFVVADKPAGLPAVPGRPVELHDCLATRVQAHFADARVVHRLDQATSGLMLFARGTVAQHALAQAFEQRRVRKRYCAVVAGIVQPDHGEIELPIGFDWADRPRRHVDPQHGKPALTRWAVLARDGVGGTTRLALEPLTGRTHQLRLHLAAIGHPILGDPLYAGPGVAARAARLLLHADRLEFAHPLDGRAVEVASEAPF